MRAPASAYASWQSRIDVGALDVPELAGAAVVEAVVLQQRAHAAVDQDQGAVSPSRRVSRFMRRPPGRGSR